MNRQSLIAYKKRILSLLKILGEKDYINIPEIDTNDYSKNDHIIPFNKIKRV